jgi:hypothetical protein
VETVMAVYDGDNIFTLILSGALPKAAGLG